MAITDLFFLLLAGFFSGALNSIAGGGTFISFPALLAVGVPPISANATNTFSVFPGYLSGAFALRRELFSRKHELPKYVVISLLGGLAGAWLLLNTPELLFREMIPWLMLLATVLFVTGSKISQLLKSFAASHQYASIVGKLLLALLLLIVCVYGGFFNAGLGVILLSYLVLAGMQDINEMNAVKLLVSSCVSIIAVIVFMLQGIIAWSEGGVVLIGAVSGGYMAAHFSRKIPKQYVHAAVVIIGIIMTLYFFHDIYGTS